MNTQTLIALRQHERSRKIALINGKRSIRFARFFANLGNLPYRDRHLQVAAMHRQRALVASQRIALIKSNVKEYQS